MPPSKDTVKEFDFNAKDFERVRGLIYKRAGISLADSKQEMVYSRLARRLRATGIDSFAKYLDDLEAGRLGEEWESFTNALTTNLTSFFREAHHFPLLAEHIKNKREPLTIWCSASLHRRGAVLDRHDRVRSLQHAHAQLPDRRHRHRHQCAGPRRQRRLHHGPAGQDAPERQRRFFLRGKGERKARRACGRNCAI
jgi:chemotaxis protein methyltransferase CheR